MINHEVSWRLFKGSYFQSLIALSSDILDILAGIIIASISSLLADYPWVILLYPPALTVVGDVSGVFTGRLTTALHLGTIKPKIRENTESYYGLQISSTILALINMALVSIVAFLIASSMKIKMPGMAIFLMMSFLMIMLPSILSIYLITPIIGGISYKKGYDPDILLYPIISTVSDILTSIFFIFIILIYVFNKALLYIISSSLLLITLLIFYLLHGNSWSGIDFLSEYKSGMIAITFLTVLSVFTGRLLAELKESFSRYPIILFIYPSLIKTIGDQGAIISSTTTTRLNLGVMKASLKGFLSSDVLATVATVIGAGITVTMSYIIGATIYYDLGGLSAIFITYITALYFFVTIPIIILTGIVSIATYKYGLDPDNFTIPSITTLSDFSTTVLLVIVLSMILF